MDIADFIVGAALRGRPYKDAIGGSQVNDPRRAIRRLAVLMLLWASVFQVPKTVAA
jgi:hypothetical protein